MNAIRVSRGAMVVSVLLTLTVAVAFSGVPGCSTGTDYLFECGGPDGGFTGTDNSLTCDCPCGGTCCISGYAGCGPYPKGNCPFLDAGAHGGDAGGTDGGDADST